MAPISNANPSNEMPPTRPGRMKRIQMHMNTAMGIVETTVNMPHGLSESAFITINASTARIMKSVFCLAARRTNVALSRWCLRPRR